jgi:hypothetical protein
MCATHAILTTMTRRQPRFDLLGGTVKSADTIKITRTILANSWGVEDRDGLLATLTNLRDGGERKAYASKPDDGLGPNGLLAWDFVRLCAVAGWGFAGDYASEDEAYAFMVPAAKELQRAYGSWAELEQAYVKAVYAWDPDAGADAERRYGILMGEKDGPWTLAWGTSLDATEPAGAAPAPPPPATPASGGQIPAIIIRGPGETTGTPMKSGGIPARTIVSIVAVVLFLIVAWVAKSFVGGHTSHPSSSTPTGHHGKK